MENVEDKLEKIINSQEFWEDVKTYFKKLILKDEQNTEEAYQETKDYLRNKYFVKFEDEYNSEPGSDGYPFKMYIEDLANGVAENIFIEIMISINPDFPPLFFDINDYF